MGSSSGNSASVTSPPITSTRVPDRCSPSVKYRPDSTSAASLVAMYSGVVPKNRVSIRLSPLTMLPPLSDTGATASTNCDFRRSCSPYASFIRGRFRISHQSTSPLNQSMRLRIKTSRPRNAILFSKVWSSPEIRVPISVTDKTPITIPRAVRIDRDLLANIEPSDMRRFSQKSAIIKMLLHFLMYLINH